MAKKPTSSERHTVKYFKYIDSLVAFLDTNPDLKLLAFSSVGDFDNHGEGYHGIFKEKKKIKKAPIKVKKVKKL